MMDDKDFATFTAANMVYVIAFNDVFVLVYLYLLLSAHACVCVCNNYLRPFVTSQALPFD